MTPVVSTVWPASAGERRSASSVPVVRAKSRISAWAGVTARISSLFWSSATAGAGVGAGWPSAAAGGRRRRRVDRADDLDVLEQQRQLDAERVDARHHRHRAVVQDLDHREGVAAEADDQVEVVADVEQVADTRELVDRDRERAPARRHGQRHERGSGSRSCGPAGRRGAPCASSCRSPARRRRGRSRSRTSTGSVCS